MFRRRFLRAACVLAAFLSASVTAVAAEAFRFPEGKYEQGEFKYINDLPVMILQGTPEEIGRQQGRLAPQISEELLKLPKQLLADRGAEAAWPVVVLAARAMFARVPTDYQKELEAICQTGKIDRDTLVVANTLLELRRIGGCSALIVLGNRSAAGGPLFGRNFDFPPMGFLDKYSLVSIYRPKGKHAFVSVGFPGLIGVVSGMNDAGLALATLDVYATADGSVMFDPGGTPLMFCYRRVLEECQTVDEAEKLLRSIKPTTRMNLAVCDQQTGAVFELTPKNLEVRRPVKDVLACTNHFRTPKLTTDVQCPRYRTLEAAFDRERFAFEDVARLMHAVNQGPATLQTMVFEPKAGKLHLGIGPGPASARPLMLLELAPLFRQTPATRSLSAVPH
jgi:isopenicillin-N N-acyltransferase-like protein